MPELAPAVENDSANRRMHLILLLVLLLFGIYQSVVFFGYKVVPNSDFPGFVRVAQSLLSFDLPSNYKRAPVLGILQIGLSHFTGGHHPVLTAGWLLNAILHPLNLLLLYLIGKKFLGHAAFYFALIVAIKPWTVAMVTEPIVETTLIFFILLTLYLILRRSPWCYLTAAIASMARYEGGALVVAAFVIDMLDSSTKRQRIKALVLSALALIPLFLWMLGAVLEQKTTATGTGITGVHYIRNYGRSTVVGKYINYLWVVGFKSLLQSPAAARAMFQPATQQAQEHLKASLDSLHGFSQILALAGSVIAIVYNLIKRKWNIVGLLTFFVLVFLAHALRDSTRDRYCVPIAWLTILFCLTGLRTVGTLFVQKARPPGWLIICLQAGLSLTALIWLIKLLGVSGKLTQFSPGYSALPFIILGLVVLVMLIRLALYKTRFLGADVTLAILITLIAVSNQFALVRTVKDGKKDAEFKLLADWYVLSAHPGEKIATTLPSTVQLFAPRHARNFVHTRRMKADSPADFVKNCYKKNISYIAWDSRIGFTPKNKYYRNWGCKNIAMLAQPKDNGPYQFIKQIKINQRRFINIFHLKEPPKSP